MHFTSNDDNIFVNSFVIIPNPRAALSEFVYYSAAFIKGLSRIKFLYGIIVVLFYIISKES